MSPEQAAGLSITPASDWYSVGVMLYEAIDGPAAVHRAAAGVSSSPSRPMTPPSPLTLVVGLPEDLVRALRGAARSRSGGAPDGPGDDRLADRPGAGRARRRPSPAGRMPLIGRRRHRQVLDTAVRLACRGGTTQSVFVFGRTGTGKTTLIRSFLEGLIAKRRGGRAVGTLLRARVGPVQGPGQPDRRAGRHLKGLPCARSRGAAAGRRRLPGAALSRACRASRRSRWRAARRPEMPDQQELRRRAFAGLRELLRRLGETGAA